MPIITERPTSLGAPPVDDPAVHRRALAERLGHPEFRTADDRLLTLVPGQVVALHGDPGSGLTRVGLALLADVARQAPVVAVDVRGWISPLGAWEVGIPPERFVLVRDVDPARWPQVIGTLLDGVKAVYAELPPGVPDAVVRRAAAGARSRRVGLVLRPLQGTVPAGVAHLTLESVDVDWAGVGSGVGHLADRRLGLRAAGKAVAGTERHLRLDDDGSHPLHLVGRVAPAPPRRAAG